MKLFKKAKKGFTLVELVVVIAVIAILAAVSVGAYFGVTTSANNSAAEQEAKAVHTNIMLVVNQPNSGYTLDKDGKIQFADGNTFKTFVDAIEDMSGINFVSVEKAADNTWTPNDTDTGFDVKKQGRIYIVEEATTFTYISTANVEKTINLKTGAFVA